MIRGWSWKFIFAMAIAVVAATEVSGRPEIGSLARDDDAAKSWAFARDTSSHPVDSTDVTTRRVSLLSDLKSLRVRPGIVTVGGYHVPADGGGGEFIWVAGDTSVPDDGLVVEPLQGAVGRYRRSVKGPYDPRWWGARVDGRRDDTNAWRAALAAIQSASGGMLRVPTGRSRVDGPLNYVGDNLVIAGDTTSSVIVKSNGTGDLFTIVGDKIRFSGFIVEAAAHTSGTLFSVKARGGNVWIDGVLTDRGYNVFELAAFGTPAQVFISNSVFNNFVNDGLRPGPNFGGQLYISNVRLGCDPSTNVGRGLHLESGDTFHIVNVDVSSCHYPIVFAPPAGNTLVNVFAANVTADGVGRGTAGRGKGGAGWTLDGTAAGATLRRVKLTNVWGGTNVSHGFSIAGGDDIALTNCIAITNGGHGLFLTSSPTNIKVNGCTFTGNSFNSNGIFSGIFVDDRVAQFSLSANISKPIAGMTNSQKYGIEMKGLLHDRYVIVDNDVAGNLAGSVAQLDHKGFKTVRGNLGYVTTATGSAAIANARSVDVTHGLSIVPKMEHIQITPTSDPGAGVRWWVSRASGAAFTVSTNATAAFTFSWSIVAFP